MGNPYAGKTPPLKTVVSSNVPLRGEKAQLYEGGVRVAAFAHWPGVLKPRKLTAPLHAVDWMPTLTRLAGWERPAEQKFDGLDLWPLLMGTVPAPSARTIYIPLPNGSAVYHGDWKLITRKGKAQPKTELFNIVQDPYETSDLAAHEPARAQELQAILKNLQAEDVTTLPADLAGFKP